MLINKIPKDYLLKASYLLIVISFLLNTNEVHVILGLVLFFLGLALNIYSKKERLFQLWKNNKPFSIMAIIGIAVYVMSVIGYVNKKPEPVHQQPMRKSFIDSIFGK